MTPGRTVAVLALAAALAAGSVTGASPASLRQDLEAAHAAQAEAARRYRESLEALLPLRELAVARAQADLDRRRALVEQGLIAAAEVSEGERALAAARAAAQRTRAAIGEAETVVTEAEVAREVAALPTTAPGEVRAGERLIRHDGRGEWSLAALPSLERFFAGRFGRPLPVSARGQTPVHDRLGFAHHDALDVAVHPDSVEGRALLAHLRRHGIPFLAFRSAVAGAATGAHVHVGPPSSRLSSDLR